MKIGTLSTSLDAPLYKLLEQPTTKLRRPFSWQRAIRSAAVGTAAFASVLTVPLGKALYWNSHISVYRAEQNQAEYHRIVSDALAKTAAQMTHHQWDANGTAYGKAGTIPIVRRAEPTETLSDINRRLGRNQ